MQYIIMCGGTYQKWETPRHLIKIHGEEIVARTIRLLKEFGVTDIAISSNNPVFNKFGVPVLTHDNSFKLMDGHNSVGHWYDAFYPTTYPVCYIFGDVVFSSTAIKTIVEERTNDIQFFASAPPFADNYCKSWAEPFALKVVNIDQFRKSLDKIKQLDAQGVFNRIPMMWELWQVIKDTPLNKIDYTNYKVINDYTCDVDDKKDVSALEKVVPTRNDVKYMIHAVPKRMWYVTEYLVPSMLEQGINKGDITIWNDANMTGNLNAWISSTNVLPDDGSTWHLQDDVIISHDFAEKSKDIPTDIVCGFCSDYDKNPLSGKVHTRNMWYSFPCILIPNKIIKKAAYWTKTEMIGNPVYEEFWINGNNDDFMFRQYVHDYCSNLTATNLNPNIVDHVDWLIGGTVGGKERPNLIRSKYWTDECLIDELKQKLKERNHAV